MSIQALLRQVIVSVLILMGSGANSQVCLDTLDIGQDTALCAGQSLVLDAGANYLDYLWSTGATASSITVNSTGTYWCRTHIIDSTNLVVNGDFSLGNNYFSSSYGYGTGGPYGLLSLEGKYAISTNASLTHTNFSACTDHTTGTGNFMIVNGSSTVNTHIWCQSISILPNTDYIFSAWFTSVHPSNPAILNFTINNQNIGPLVSLSGTTCNWQNFFQVWNSGANTSATICITNQNTAISGNDFALDDIYFAQECTFYDTVNVEVFNYPVVDLGPDRTICRGDSVVLDATADSTSSYLWYNGSTAPMLTADSSAVIWVEVANGHCHTVDSMMLEVIEYPVVDLGSDTVICDGSSIWLNAQNDSSTYLWSNGSSSPGIFAILSGTYWVDVTRGNCQVSDTINVSISAGPAANLGPDKEICTGDSVLLYPGPANRYLWNNGDTASQITVSPSSFSTFIVQLFDGFGCSSSDSVSIVPIPLPEAMIYWSGDSICAGASVVLMAGPAGAYLWSTGAAIPMITVKPYVSDSFFLTVSNSSNGVNCYDDTSVFVTVSDCNHIYFPNAFTPNADGINDFIGPVGILEGYESYELFIFNRWGQQVFYSNSFTELWDGRINGKDAPSGTYPYLGLPQKSIDSSYSVDKQTFEC